MNETVQVVLQLLGVHLAEVVPGMVQLQKCILLKWGQMLHSKEAPGVQGVMVGCCWVGEAAARAQALDRKQAALDARIQRAQEAEARLQRVESAHGQQARAVMQKV